MKKTKKRGRRRKKEKAEGEGRKKKEEEEKIGNKKDVYVCLFTYLFKKKKIPSFLWTLGSKSIFPTWLQVICATHRIDCRVGVNLQSVDVITGVLEQAVVRVQHLM